VASPLRPGRCRRPERWTNSAPSVPPSPCTLNPAHRGRAARRPLTEIDVFDLAPSDVVHLPLGAVVPGGAHGEPRSRDRLHSARRLRHPALHRTLRDTRPLLSQPHSGPRQAASGCHRCPPSATSEARREGSRTDRSRHGAVATCRYLRWVNAPGRIRPAMPSPHRSTGCAFPAGRRRRGGRSQDSPDRTVVGRSHDVHVQSRTSGRSSKFSRMYAW